VRKGALSNIKNGRPDKNKKNTKKNTNQPEPSKGEGLNAKRKGSVYKRLKKKKALLSLDGP